MTRTSRGRGRSQSCSLARDPNHSRASSITDFFSIPHTLIRHVHAFPIVLSDTAFILFRCVLFGRSGDFVHLRFLITAHVSILPVGPLLGNAFVQSAVGDGDIEPNSVERRPVRLLILVLGEKKIQREGQGPTRTHFSGF